MKDYVRIKKFLSFIDLNSGEENQNKVLENVKSSITFQGSNLWVLACAIVIASIGLNVNSVAVIIGAMLISPLMGPIVGAGFSLGIFDFPLLRKSLRNLVIATVVGLIVSTIFFLLSPFKEAQSEILARTSPNIYDVVIAFFGGLVGVIALTRVEKGNPIPGVAIATALMPPLCTAGYGLAIGNLNYFFGALFLYIINCVFICISTYFIVKYLKYPAVIHLDKGRQKLVRYVITALTAMMILPSIYLAYVLLDKKQYSLKIDTFIEHEFTNNGYTIIHEKMDLKNNPKILELAFLRKKFTDDEVLKLNQKLINYDLTDTKLVIIQDTTDIKNFIKNEINTSNSLVNANELLIADLEAKLAANSYDNMEILAEAKILFPSISNLSIANHTFNGNTDSMAVVPVMIYQSITPLSDSNQQILGSWLKQKLKKEELKLYRED